MSTCYLNERGPMCDSVNNRCVCGPGDPECGKGEYCEDEKCSGKILYIYKITCVQALKLVKHEM